METKQIAAALVKAQRGFSPALKTNTNPHFRSKYADLSACVEAVIDALNENGIMLMQLTRPYEGGVCVSTRFIHESGETMDAGELTVPASKQDPQGYGSALTYARRYSLMAACGIAPEDDDGNAASKPRKEPQSPSASGSPTKIEWANAPESKRVTINEYVVSLGEFTEKENYDAAFDLLESFGLDSEDKVLLWSQLDSKTRSAFKRIGESRRAA